MLISCPRLPENRLGARLFVRNFTHYQKEQVTLPYRFAERSRRAAERHRRGTARGRATGTASESNALQLSNSVSQKRPTITCSRIRGWRI